MHGGRLTCVWMTTSTADFDHQQVTDAAQLDDAEAAAGAGDSVSDQDYSRGKRFRKLHRVLTGAAVSHGYSLLLQRLLLPPVHSQVCATMQAS